MRSKITFLVFILVIGGLMTISIGSAKSITMSDTSKVSSKLDTISKANADITAVVWNRPVLQYTSVTVTIKNTDNASAHTYQVCVEGIDTAGLSRNAGAGADCSTSSSVSAGATGSVQVNFSQGLDNIDTTKIFIEQLS